MFAAGRHLSLFHGCDLALDIAEFQSTWKPPPIFTYELDYFNIAGKEILVNVGQRRFERSLQPLRWLGVTLAPQWVVQNQYPSRLDRLARRTRMGYPDWWLTKLPADVYLAGYFQSPKYFEGSEDIIRRDLTFVKSTGVEKEMDELRQQSDLPGMC